MAWAVSPSPAPLPVVPGRDIGRGAKLLLSSNSFPLLDSSQTPSPNMSKTVEISSPSQFSEVLQSSKLVVVDCKSYCASPRRWYTVSLPRHGACCGGLHPLASSLALLSPPPYFLGFLKSHLDRSSPRLPSRRLANPLRLQFMPTGVGLASKSLPSSNSYHTRSRARNS